MEKKGTMSVLCPSAGLGETHRGIEIGLEFSAKGQGMRK
jgi:hypothetical protein